MTQLKKSVVFIYTTKIIIEEQQYNALKNKIKDILSTYLNYSTLDYACTQCWTCTESGTIHPGICREYRPEYTAPTLIEVLLYREGLLPAEAMNPHHNDVDYWLSLPHIHATKLTDSSWLWE